MITVLKTYLPPLEQYTAYLEQIWETHQITNNGPLLKELECKLKQYLQTPYLCYVSNGTYCSAISVKSLEHHGRSDYHALFVCGDHDRDFMGTVPTRVCGY